MAGNGADEPCNLVPSALGDARALVDNPEAMTNMAAVEARRTAGPPGRPAHSRSPLLDTATGLAARSLFLDRLGRALARGGQPAVVLIALDETACPGAILRALALRFAPLVENPDTLAALGPAELAVLVENAPGLLRPVRLAHRLAAAAALPVAAAGGKVHPAITIGIAGASGVDIGPAAVLACARAALVSRRRRVPGRILAFDTEAGRAAEQRLALERGLREAVAEGGLALSLQPIVTICSGILEGAVASAQWRDPVRGLVAADACLAGDEGSDDLRGDVAAWVRQEVCAQVDPAGSLRGLPVVLPATAAELTDPGFPTRLRRLQARSGIAPAAWAISVSEPEAMANPTGVAEGLAALRRAGLRTRLTGFGSGGLPVRQLHQLAVDAVLIDPSFVAGLADDPHAVSLLAALSAPVRSLGMTSIATGVETEQQASAVAAAGIDQAAGTWFAAVGLLEG
jgi:EAL domain-containing protein (putative c-di-GMP-specific phosphodiesterase class I)/GGDEF domain-containing protein